MQRGACRSSRNHFGVPDPALLSPDSEYGMQIAREIRDFLLTVSENFTLGIVLISYEHIVAQIVTGTNQYAIDRAFRPVNILFLLRFSEMPVSPEEIVHRPLKLGVPHDIINLMISFISDASSHSRISTSSFSTDPLLFFVIIGLFRCNVLKPSALYRSVEFNTSCAKNISAHPELRSKCNARSCLHRCRDALLFLRMCLVCFLGSGVSQGMAFGKKPKIRRLHEYS